MILSSSISTSSAQFKENQRAYGELSDNLRTLLEQAALPEDPQTGARLAKQGKLSAAQRLQQLIDPGSAVLELAPLAGYEMYSEVPAGAGIRTCLAKVAGRTCAIIANIPSVKGGTYYPLTIKKHLRAQEIAQENALPCIYLVDSGGAFLPLQAEVFPDKEHFGRIFYNQARMSRSGIPQISVVLGSCTAGGAYIPAMSDEVIMVRNQSTIFLGGPPLVRAATGEEVSAEELGGAEVHCTQSGVGDQMADSETEALFLARRSIANIGSRLRFRSLTPSQEPAPPRYDPQEIYGIIGTNLNVAFPVREILARLLDDSRFDEFKPHYGTSLVCGFAHLEGFALGVIANDGILFSESALKATHFIQLCNQRGIPLLFLQNIMGFMVGKAYEHGGIAKDGAKMVNAVACATVPKLTLIIGGSFGAGNYSMCGRAYSPRFLYSWPNSRISVMGGTQAARVLTDIRRSAGQKREAKVDENELRKFHSEIQEKYETEGHAFYASARLWDDGVIDPLATRRHLALSLASCAHDNPGLGYGIFRM